MPTENVVGAAPTEKLTKAAGLTVASTVTGGLRDVLVAAAFTVSRKSDGFFGLFLITQFLYMIAVGGHLLSLGRLGGLGPSVRDGFYHTRFRPRLRVMAIVSAVVAVPLLHLVYEESVWGAVLAGAVTAVVLLGRGEAEYRAYVASSGGHLNAAMLAAIWQNLFIIVACAASWAFGITTLLLAVIGVAAGFLAQAVHLRRWKPGPRPTEVANLKDYDVSRDLSARELLLYGGPAIEQVLLGGLPGGTGTIVVFARRIAGTVPAAFAVPMAMKLIARSDDRSDARADTAIVIRSLAVLVILSLAVAQLAVVGLRSLRDIEHSGVNLGQISQFRLPLLLALTILTTVGSITNLLHAALGRTQQALGQHRRVLVTSAIGTALQLIGVAVGVMLRSPEFAVGCFSVAWLVAALRDFGSLVRWPDVVAEQRLVLIGLPLLFLATTAPLAWVPVGGVGRELALVAFGLVPTAIYGLLFLRSRRGPDPTWI